MNTTRLRHFVQEMTRVVESNSGNEAALLQRGQA